MYLPTVRPLLAVVAAGTAVALLGACGGKPSTADAAANTTAPAASSASGSPTTSTSAGAGGASGAQGGSGGGQSGKGSQPAATKPAAVGARAAVRACSLVSSAEAGTAMHISGSMQTKTNSGAECEYDSTAGDSVDIEVQAVQFTPDLPNAMTEMLPAAQTTRINGLGDAAVLFTPTANLAQFHLWKDGLYVVLIVSRSGLGSASGAATSLGQTIASRI